MCLCMCLVAWPAIVCVDFSPPPHTLEKFPTSLSSWLAFYPIRQEGPSGDPVPEVSCVCDPSKHLLLALPHPFPDWILTQRRLPMRLPSPVSDEHYYFCVLFCRDLLLYYYSCMHIGWLGGPGGRLSLPATNLEKLFS